jgi:hypothetical protein
MYNAQTLQRPHTPQADLSRCAMETPDFIRSMNRARHAMRQAELSLKPFGNVAPDLYQAKIHCRDAIKELAMTLVTQLSSMTPGQLRAKLSDPDPIQLHDWHITAEDYRASIRLVLIIDDERHESHPNARAQRGN